MTKSKYSNDIDKLFLDYGPRLLSLRSEFLEAIHELTLKNTPKPRHGHLNDDKEELRVGLQLIDLVKQYGEPHVYGRKAKMKCIFHNDKTPSLSIDLDKNVFHCFGCNTSGDIFAWLMKAHDLTFSESLEMAKKLI